MNKKTLRNVLVLFALIFAAAGVFLSLTGGGSVLHVCTEECEHGEAGH